MPHVEPGPARTAVLDTSVVIKWFYHAGGEDIDAALLVRKAFFNGDLSIIIPDLLIYEFANALRFKSQLDPADVTEMVQSLWSLGLMVVPIDRNLSAATVESAYHYGLTIYDATFVALAQQLSANLITADRTLYENIKDLDGAIYLPTLSG